MKGYEKRLVLSAVIDGNDNPDHRGMPYHFEGGTVISAPGLYRIDVKSDGGDASDCKSSLKEVFISSVNEKSVVVRYSHNKTKYEEKPLNINEKCRFEFSCERYTDDGQRYSVREEVSFTLSETDIEYEYSGDTSLDGQRQGYGECRYDDGSVYTGGWLDDKRSGYGTERCGNMCYEGYWKDGKKHGTGIMRNDELSIIYIGDWENNALSGNGTEYSVSFRVDPGKAAIRNSAFCYQGEWKNGLRHGYGIYDTPDFVQQAFWECGKPQRIIGFMRKDDEDDESNTDCMNHGIRPVMCEASGKLPIGSSKLFGNPDVWDGFEWPSATIDGEEFKLTFMCQINCADIAPLDAEHLLPEAGILYFFYDLDGMPDEPTDKQAARVLYYNGEISELKPSGCDTNDEAEVISEIPLRFVKVRRGYTPRGDSLHMLLGGMPGEAKSSEIGDWRSLLRIDSMETDNVVISFANNGKLHFCIEPDRLKRHDYSDVRVIRSDR